eukprot:1313145-Amphidinium_carterae.1
MVTLPAVHGYCAQLELPSPAPGQAGVCRPSGTWPQRRMCVCTTSSGSLESSMASHRKRFALPNAVQLAQAGRQQTPWPTGCHPRPPRAIHGVGRSGKSVGSLVVNSLIQEIHKTATDIINSVNILFTANGRW